MDKVETFPRSSNLSPRGGVRNGPWASSTQRNDPFISDLEDLEDTPDFSNHLSRVPVIAVCNRRVCVASNEKFLENRMVVLLVGT